MVFPLQNSNTCIFAQVCKVKSIFHTSDLRTETNFSFHLKKGLIIITTCFGVDSKDQNELQYSEMQWSCLLFYKEIEIVQGYFSYIILNHYIFPRAWSFLFVLGLLYLDFPSDLRKPWDPPLTTQNPCPGKHQWCTQCVLKTQQWNYMQLGIRLLQG